MSEPFDINVAHDGGLMRLPSLRGEHPVGGHTANLGMSMPPDPALMRVVRLVASGLSSLTPMGIDAVDAVRQGVDELVGTLMDASDGANILVWFVLDGSELTVDAATLSRRGGFAPSPSSDVLLDRIAARHDWRAVGPAVGGTVVYELAPSDGD